MYLDQLYRDCLYAVRLWRRAPLSASIVAVTLALAIGATTALFAIVHAVVLAPLPYPSPERVVAVWETAPREGYPTFRVAPGNFADWAARNRVFEEMAMFGAGTWQATDGDEPQQWQGAAVGPGYFRVLGVQPMLGRAFTESDVGANAEPVAILSHALWQSRFGARRDVLGRTIRLDGTLVTVVGVMPPGIYPMWPQTTGGFNFLPGYQQIWRPFRLSADLAATRRAHVFGVIARLRRGVTLADAQRGMDDIAARLSTAYASSNAGAGVFVRSLHDEVAGGVRPVLLVLLGAVTVTLLAACANVANMMLLRSAARRRELAVRATLGASRGSVVRLVLIESALLALSAGAIGTFVAWAGLDAIVALAPYEMPRAADIALDAPAMLSAGALTILAALIVGVLPAIQASRLELRGALQADGRSAGATSGSRSTRRLLIAFEVATAVVLLAGALLSARSFSALRSLDPGFTADHVLAFELSLPRAAAGSPARIDAFQSALVERLGALHDARDAAIGYDLPLEATWVDGFAVEGRPPAAPDEVTTAVLKIVSPGYFRTLSVARVRGRLFTDDDRMGRPGIVVVNDAFARAVFRGEDPIGRHLSIRTPSLIYGDAVPSRYEIVGIVGNVHSRGLDAPAAPAYYVSSRQFPQASMTAFVRTRGNPADLATAVRATVRSLDASLPVVNMQALEAHVAAALARPRFLFSVLSAFASAALLLSGLGVYGLLAYIVVQRRGELAVRQALGATRVDLVRLVVGEGVVLAVGGAIVGEVVALALGRVLSAVLYQVGPADPVSLTSAPVTIVSTALVATLVPAWRASRVDATAVLKGE